ncbi:MULTISPECIES: cation:proton antiporter [Corynebacterium]|uniref:Multisubunit sodium/proton antiporter, MrpF subunit n=1 Tax=Corynebacterium singulare TaxID=161899 RepID=A0A0B6F221_9CORY|nr:MULTISPECIES: cation:proton antiporter [Corynebacterium]AJI79249.1 multisubunit sodium/proton antiporter, MrpF subunit [Corynebacterium singulare]MCQ9675551.1 cation:proton antiporter [Corynebacterium sp. BF-R-2]
MIDFASWSAFNWVVFVCVFIMGACVCAALGLALRSRDELTRTVMSDMVFYGMMCMYFSWAMTNNASIVYDIAMLAGIAAGVLPTLSMARIISKGRR